jgi:hypothetical protein
MQGHSRKGHCFLRWFDRCGQKRIYDPGGWLRWRVPKVGCKINDDLLFDITGQLHHPLAFAVVRAKVLKLLVQVFRTMNRKVWIFPRQDPDSGFCVAAGRLAK